MNYSGMGNQSKHHLQDNELNSVKRDTLREQGQDNYIDIKQIIHLEGTDPKLINHESLPPHYSLFEPKKSNRSQYARKRKVLPLRWHTKQRTKSKGKDVSVIVNKSVNLRPGRQTDNQKPHDRTSCISPIDRSKVVENDYNCYEDEKCKKVFEKELIFEYPQLVKTKVEIESSHQGISNMNTMSMATEQNSFVDVNVNSSGIGLMISDSKSPNAGGKRKVVKPDFRRIELEQFPDRRKKYFIVCGIVVFLVLVFNIILFCT